MPNSTDFTKPLRNTKPPFVFQPNLTEAWYRLYLAAGGSGDVNRARHAEGMFRKLRQETEKHDAIQSFIYSMRQ